MRSASLEDIAGNLLGRGGQIDLDAFTDHIIYPVGRGRARGARASRSDASSVALRFERYVRQPELADCKELAITVDGAVWFLGGVIHERLLIQ